MKIFKVALSVLLMTISNAADTSAVEIVVTKHIIDAPAPVDQPQGAVTPDGTFNVRDPNAPFHSEVLADAMGLDAEGRHPNGGYLNLNHAVYTSYRLASDSGPVDTVLTLMPGTWVGAMSIDQVARDLLRMAAEDGRKGIEVWLVDRRSEQLEDHTGLRWAQLNLNSKPIEEIIQGISDYYRPRFEPEGYSIELLDRRFVPLDHDSVRFMANWGGDTTIRDWRAVVLEAHRKIGNDVIETEGGEPRVVRKPGRRVFIGGHSLGGSLTVLYAAYDFDRRSDRELIGADDVDGLVLLEGGGFSREEPETLDADKYRKSLKKRFKDGKVYFDFDILGIRYAPSTMLSLAVIAWTADNARGMECPYPMETRPEVVQLDRITNEAVLGFVLDDDFSPFFIARVSMGYPAGELGEQFRKKRMSIPFDPGECKNLTPWKSGHRPMDEDFLYDWINIDTDTKPLQYGKRFAGKCSRDHDESPEVTDFYAFARSVYSGPDSYEEAPWLSSGPNDFAEWYFPPRLSSDSGKRGNRIVEKDGTELFNGTHIEEISLPVISFVGDDSMGEFRVPELNEEDFTPGALAHPATQVHLIRGYTHMDITAATRNNQPDLAPDHEDFNACAAYTYRFLKQAAGW